VRPIRGRRTRQKRKGPGRGMHEGREHVGPVPHEALVLQQRPCYSKHTRTCTHAHVNMHMRTHMQRHTHVSSHKQTLNTGTHTHTHTSHTGRHPRARKSTHTCAWCACGPSAGCAPAECMQPPCPQCGKSRGVCVCNCNTCTGHGPNA